MTMRLVELAKLSREELRLHVSEMSGVERLELMAEMNRQCSLMRCHTAQLPMSAFVIQRIPFAVTRFR